MITIEAMLMTAKNAGASDVHITVGLPPKIRINGSLSDMDYPKLMPTDTDSIIMPLMNKQQLAELTEKGEVDFAYSLPQLGRYRVNVFKQRGSLACSIRIVDTEIPDASLLGIPESVINLYRKKRGLILVTGPAGSGKSTTLAALLDAINANREAHVITLEDPIEYLHNHKKSIVNQREVGIDTATYSSGIRSALREDPDVILVGEMRDLETISTAINAAETGHLVLSTLHTIGAASTIDRMIEVFPPHQQQQIRIQLSMVLNAIISQQLIPTVDKKQRVPAFEIMFGSSAVKTLIREGNVSQITSVIENNKAKGMQTMDDAIYELYSKGIISRDNALSYAQNMIGMELRI